MKRKFLVLGMFLITLVSTSINAQKVNFFERNGIKAFRKDSPSFPYYRASGNSEISLTGAPDSNYKRLPFTKYKKKFHNDVYPSEDNKSFILEKGSYEIYFTATFTGTAGTDANTSEIAIQVGDKLYNLNTNRTETDTSYDYVQTVSTAQLFKFKKQTKISFVARNISADSTTTISQRTISIIKIS